MHYLELMVLFYYADSNAIFDPQNQIVDPENSQQFLNDPKKLFHILQSGPQLFFYAKNANQDMPVDSDLLGHETKHIKNTMFAGMHMIQVAELFYIRTSFDIKKDFNQLYVVFDANPFLAIFQSAQNQKKQIQSCLVEYQTYSVKSVDYYQNN